VFLIVHHALESNLSLRTSVGDGRDKTATGGGVLGCNERASGEENDV
jgi:hypothetical protein